MKKIHRAVHIDFHTMPGISDFGMGFTGESIAETLKGAHVDYVNVFARCNIGFSYYPTKVGIPYPGMEGNLLGDTIRECHKRDIGVTAYINGGLHHELLLKHPEYMRVNKEGQVHKGDPAKNNFFRSPCLHTGYRAYLYEEIKEVMAMGPDGIFLDCVRAESCYCPACREKMAERGIDIEDDAAVLQFAYDTQLEAFREIRDIVPKDMRLFFNSFPYDMISELTSHFEMECLPYSGYWYDYCTVMAPYFRKIASDRVYMTGRFLQSWGDFGGSKTKSSIEHDVYEALLYGYAPSVGDHMHPRDGLDAKLYEQIGRVYEYVEALEPWTEGTRPVTEVAVFGNKAEIGKNGSTMAVPGKPRPTIADIGAARMLAELKVCYDLINEDMDFDDYRLIIIPENVVLTDTLCEKLERFEGAILSAGNSIRGGSVWNYISEYHTDDNTDAFYRYKEETLGQYRPGICMKSDYGLADYVAPYFKREYDGKHGYFYIPPKDVTEYSAAALKGKRAHISFHIFEAYQQYRAHFHKALVKDLIDQLLPDRLIMADSLPSTARVSLMQGDPDTKLFTGEGNPAKSVCPETVKSYHILHVKTTYPELRGPVGIIEEHNVLPAGKKICIKGQYDKVYRLPEMTEVSCAAGGDYTEIELPEITGYAPFLLV